MALFGIADAVVGVVGNVLDKFVEDKDLRAKLNHELKTQVQEANLAQIAVNQEQARHPLWPELDLPLCGYVPLVLDGSLYSSQYAHGLWLSGLLSWLCLSYQQKD